MSPRAHRWRRGDGAVLSCTDLDVAVPMMLHELADIKDLVNVVEQWLRFEDTAWYLLTDWLIAISNYDPDDCEGPQPSAQEIITALGELSAKLHRILTAGIPTTGHRHPPTPNPAG